jgi:heme-degrading monooxygenase HmoA
MAIGLYMEFLGGTEQQYEAVLRELQLGGHTAPGGVFHCAGPMEDGTGWRVVDVWESQADFDRFRREKLDAALRKVGLEMPGRIISWPVHNVLLAERAPEWSHS